jgi:alpha-beta hydrolase superfamily lysophospholipase
MRTTDGSFQGRDGADIHWQAWLPDAEPDAVVLLAHGLAEHAGRYAHVGAGMAERGLAVYAPDHRGHGRSSGPRTQINSIEHAVDDLHTFAGIVKERHPSAPTFLLGHSMGGAIAFAYALRHQSELQGLVLSAPAVVIEGVSPVTIAAGKLLSKLVPNAGVLQLDGTAVSRDPEVVKRYDSDPLNYRGKVVARTGAELVALADVAAARLPELKLPLLVMQGTADRLVPVKAAQLVYDRTGSADKTIKTWDGLYHEILNEPEREQVLGEMIAWVEARIPARAPGGR